MLACALDIGYSTGEGTKPKDFVAESLSRLDNPDKASHRLAIVLFEKIKEVEIINEINQN